MDLFGDLIVRIDAFAVVAAKGTESPCISGDVKDVPENKFRGVVL